MQLDSYREAYRNIRFERRDGVLAMSLHTAGGPLLFSIAETGIHAQLGRAFADVASDPENRVVILTGSGGAFCETFDRSDMPADYHDAPRFYDRMYREGLDLILKLLDIPVPVIGAINGPALLHAEVAVLSDVVLAADHAVIADVGHFPNGTVPGDGVHVCWQLLLGPNRARYFLMTGEKLSAEEAKRLGVVGEVLPADRLMNRAWELGAQIAAKPELCRRHTRAIFMRHLKQRMQDELGYGLSLEFTASAAQRQPAAKG
jgi:enoyl-CoA hydratase/carnithine racemase